MPSEHYYGKYQLNPVTEPPYLTLSSTFLGKNRNSPKTIDGTAAYVVPPYFIAYIRSLSGTVKSSPHYTEKKETATAVQITVS
jgi:hypothetical protein